MDSLPTELLMRIFRNVPIPNRLNVALVCSAWNQVMFSFPEIWRDVSYYPIQCRSDSALGQLLELSGHGPLNLDVAINDRGCASICESIRRALHRCVHLRIELWSNGTTRGVLQREITQALTSGHAPLLRSFILVDSDSSFNPECSPDANIFSSIAPRLREVNFTGDIWKFEGSFGVLRDVRTARFVCHDWPCSWKLIRKLLAALPKVENLELTLTSWDQEMLDAGPQGDLDIPPSLRSFSIFTRQTAHAHSIVKRLRHASIPFLITRPTSRLPAKYEGDILNDLCAVPVPRSALLEPTASASKFVPRSFLHSTTTPGLLSNIVLFDKDVFLSRRVIRGQSPEDLAKLQDANARLLLDIGPSTPISDVLFTHITRLYITETAFTTAGRPPPQLPALQHLTIYTVKTRSYKRWDVYSAFDSSPPKPHEVVYRPLWPDLRTVCISVRHRELSQEAVTLPIRLTPEMICVFLSTYILHGEPLRSLELLELRGLELLVIDPMGLQRLLSMTETMQCFS
ncbi:hypothetical protein BKA62DRAFT_189646 [Auriculariales sp. MPI-PUGE-AT-0066]|nr:hypothetical protein BKA62DRAFT_189646 [Auriculariales sp. MPI-PUGE-AT-0066]